MTKVAAQKSVILMTETTICVNWWRPTWTYFQQGIQNV